MLLEASIDAVLVNQNTHRAFVDSDLRSVTAKDWRKSKAFLAYLKKYARKASQINWQA